ncbi:hypothetical protein [Salinispira pacifica]|uniref:hypothetical protein n=1 Tax=Salinispira pacifica TaxID=1307761 RepID=UPI001183A6F3|nr:hypothetical protein [Salinispira pacifica]
MFKVSRVVGNLHKFYTAGMKMGNVPKLGRRGGYRRECCHGTIAALLIFRTWLSGVEDILIITERIFSMNAIIIAVILVGLFMFGSIRGVVVHVRRKNGSKTVR